MNLICGDLPPSKTFAVRKFAWLPGDPFGDFRAGTLVIDQRKSPTSRVEETDKYAVQADDAAGPRVYLLANLTDDAVEDVYEVRLTPAKDYCTCPGAVAGGHKCKHALALRILHDAGDLDPPALPADPPPRVEPKPAPAADPGPELHPIRTFRRLRLDEVPF